MARVFHTANTMHAGPLGRLVAIDASSSDSLAHYLPPLVLLYSTALPTGRCCAAALRGMACGGRATRCVVLELRSRSDEGAGRWAGRHANEWKLVATQVASCCWRGHTLRDIAVYEDVSGVYRLLHSSTLQSVRHDALLLRAARVGERQDLMVLAQRSKLQHILLGDDTNQLAMVRH